jgi:hypothetical protein
MQEDGRVDRSKFQGADPKGYNYLVEKYLLPIQARIAGLLQTKIHLLADDDLPASFADFLENTSRSLSSRTCYGRRPA